MQILHVLTKGTHQLTQHMEDTKMQQILRKDRVINIKIDFK